MLLLFLSFFKSVEHINCALGTLSQGVMGTPMGIEQSMELKGAYTMMKAKYFKYKPQVKRKPIFQIATMLDSFLKLGYIPTDEKKYITKNENHCLN